MEKAHFTETVDFSITNTQLMNPKNSISERTEPYVLCQMSMTPLKPDRVLDTVLGMRFPTEIAKHLVCGATVRVTVEVL